MGRSSSFLLVGLLLWLSLATIVVQLSEAGKDSWAKVEKYLVQAGGNNDYETNLAAALEKLEKQRAQILYNIRFKRVLKALERIEDFKERLDRHQCTQESGERLDHLESKVMSRRDTPRSRVLIEGFRDEFAANCQYEHFLAFKELFPRLERQREYSRIYPFFVTIMQNRIDNHHEAQSSSKSSRKFDTYDRYLAWSNRFRRTIYENYILGDLEVSSQNDAQTAYDAAKYIVDREFSARERVKYFQKDRNIHAFDVKELFMSLIYDSCKIFVDNVGPALFNRIEADVPALARQGISNNEDNSPDWADYYMMWVLHKSCLHLIDPRNWDNVEALLENLGEIAGERADEYKLKDDMLRSKLDSYKG